MAFARAASTCERLPATPMMPPSIGVAQPQGVGNLRMLYTGLGNPFLSAISYDHVVLPLSFMISVYLGEFHCALRPVTLQEPLPLSEEVDKIYIQTIVEEYGVEIFDRSDKGAHAYPCVLKGMISGQICGLIVLQIINIATAAAYGLGVNDSIQLFAIFAGKQLEDDRTISVLGIQKLLNLRVGMQTTAKTWNNITITQNVEASDVIRALSISPLLEGRTLSKYNLRGRMHILVKTLTDSYVASGRTLSDYNIHEGNQLCQAKIPNKKGTTSVWQRLMLTSTQYGRESTLHLVLQLCGDMPISVNTLTGKTIPFDAMFYENPCIPVQSP